MRKKLSEDLCNYLESLMYEVNARKDLCAFMISKGITGDAFKDYHDEYIELNAKYELAKKEVSEILKGEGLENFTWEIDFITCEAIIHEKK